MGLVLNMLAEATTTEIFKKKMPESFTENTVEPVAPVSVVLGFGVDPAWYQTVRRLEKRKLSGSRRRGACKGAYFIAGAHGK